MAIMRFKTLGLAFLLFGATTISVWSAEPPVPPNSAPLPAQPGAQTEGEQQVAPVAQNQPAENSTEEKVLICKKLDPPIGSRTGGRKVCHTAEEWRQIQQDSKEYLDDVQRKSGTWNPQGS